MGMFDKQAAAKVAPAKPAKKDTKLTLAVAGLQEYAMIDALKKALEGVAGSFRTEVLSVAKKHFLSTICATGSKPVSVRGTDGIASASLEFRKRGSNSPLAPSEVELLRAHGFEPHEEVAVPELFAINPAYSADKALLDRVEAALKAAGVPSDFIVLQEKKFKHTVTDEMVTKVCALAKEGKAPEEVINVMSTLAIKAKLDSVEMPVIVKFVEKLLTDTPDAADSAKAAA